MTWEEIIIKIRKEPEYKDLVEKAYYEEELSLNVERFQLTEEFLETLSIIEKKIGSNRDKKILDIGSGNGISALAFALKGYAVSAVEPDKSDTVGSAAIRKLKAHYKLDNIEVFDSFGEDLPFQDASFDIVYIRQAMHHAAELDKFVSEASRVLKPKGLFLTIRDHVIYNEKDKAWFLEMHPLHKFYGGENAFTEKQYIDAMKTAGLKIESVLRYYDSVINYFPMTKVEYHRKNSESEVRVKESLQKKLRVFSKIVLIRAVYKMYLYMRYGKELDEKNIPGRMYSFVAIKQA